MLKINRYQKSYLDNIFHDQFVMNTEHLKPNQIKKRGVVMSTVDTCTTPEEDGWGLVHHFLGNILLTLFYRLVVGDKELGWESVVADRKAKLVSHLEENREKNVQLRTY